MPTVTPSVVLKVTSMSVTRLALMLPPIDADAVRVAVTEAPFVHVTLVVALHGTHCPHALHVPVFSTVVGVPAAVSVGESIRW